MSGRTIFGGDSESGLGSDRGLFAKVKIDSEDAKFKLGELEVEFGKWAVAVVTAAEIAKKGLELVGEGIEKIFEFTEKIIEAANEHEKAERRLIVALDLRHEKTAVLTRELREFNEAIQQQTGLGRDHLTQVQATLSAMGIMGEDLKKATLATIGLSERLGGDLDGAVRAVAKGIHGNIAALQKFGVEGRTVDEMITELAGQYQLAAGKSDLFATQTERAKENLHDFLAELGTGITNSKELKNLLGELNDALVKMTTWAHDHKQDISDFFDGAVKGAKLYVGFLKSAVELSLQLIPGVGTIAQIARASSGIGGLVAGSGRQPIASGSGADEAMGPDISEQQRAARQKLETEATAEIERQRKAAAAAEKERLRQIKEQQDYELKAMDWYREQNKKHEQAEQEHFHREYEAEKAQHERLKKLDLERIHDQTKIADEANKQKGLDYKVHEEREKQFYTQMVDIGVSGIASFVSGSIAAIASGQNVLSAIGSLLGSMLVQTGTQLVQMGTAAVLLNALSVIPALAPLVGPPGVGAGVGAAAIAGGIAMIAVGSLMGASGGGGGGASSGASGGGGGGGNYSAGGFSGIYDPNTRQNQQASADAASHLRNLQIGVGQDTEVHRQAGAGYVPPGFTLLPGGGMGIVYNLHFSGRPLVTEREVGREVTRLQRRANSMSGWRMAG